MKKKLVRVIACLCVMMFCIQGCNKATDDDTTTQQGIGVEKGNVSISYEFSGDDASKAGYAEGTVTVSSEDAGSYKLYWSDDEGALKGYYEIAEVKVEAGKNAEFTFDYHTAIPADAKKIIAVSASVEDEYPEVADAAGTYDIPAEKQLGGSDKALYTFNSFSDIHIDEEKFGQTPAYWWEYSEAHWAQALAYATKLDTDFIVSSGDQVTNASFDTLDKEWQAYQLILAQSDYVKPVYESGGNHEIRQDGVVAEELQAFIVGSGIDSNKETLKDAKPYYSMVEPNTGDLFIFMALESGYRPAKYEQFSTEQLDWVENLLKENYGKGKNIYIIQHVLIKGYGPGDDLETPYYGGATLQEFEGTKRFMSLLEEYKDIVWISGHSHETFSLGYNYTNNSGTACNMIHNPSIGNPTHVTDGAIDYTFNENLSEGYYVQVFEKAIVFSGANICDEKIYPAYSYIMDGNTSDLGTEAESIKNYSDVEVTDGTLRSLMANVNTTLGIYYEYSSYDQYQTLKEYYYQYKDADTYAMSDEEVLKAYSELRYSASCLHEIVSVVEGGSYVLDTPDKEVEVKEEIPARETALTVTIHYHREDGNYDPWSIWLWGTGEGTDNAFVGVDEEGAYLTYVVEAGTSELGFIVRTAEWAKDVDADQFIPVGNIEGDTVNIYIESGVEGYQIK